MNPDALSRVILDSAFRIHSALGPGLFEHVYETILAHELRKQHLQVARQVPVPIVYDGIEFEEGYRADLVVEQSVIVELKSVAPEERNLPDSQRPVDSFAYLRVLCALHGISGTSIVIRSEPLITFIAAKVPRAKVRKGSQRKGSQRRAFLFSKRFWNFGF